MSTIYTRCYNQCFLFLRSSGDKRIEKEFFLFIFQCLLNRFYSNIDVLHCVGALKPWQSTYNFILLISHFSPNSFSFIVYLQMSNSKALIVFLEYNNSVVFNKNTIVLIRQKKLDSKIYDLCQNPVEYIPTTVKIDVPVEEEEDGDKAGCGGNAGNDGINENSDSEGDTGVEENNDEQKLDGQKKKLSEETAEEPPPDNTLFWLSATIIDKQNNSVLCVTRKRARISYRNWNKHPNIILKSKKH